jgi:hypothetical protein
LYKNNLSGPFPHTITSLTGLEYLDVANNMLSGDLPEDFGSLANLYFLRINTNELEGEIPESMGDCTSLQSIRINTNNFTGSFPESFSNLNHLTHLRAYSNQFSGPFPEVLLSMKQLESLNLSENNFSGMIPAAIDSLVNLVLLSIRDNEFYGPMPKIHHLTEISEIHLRNLALSGELDTILGYHPKLYYATFSSNQFSGRISSHHYDADKMELLHLNGNNFTEIDDFTPYADTGGLRRLYIDHNALDFDDLAPNAQLDIVNFRYGNQANLGQADTIYLDEGESHTITSSMQSSMIEYAWLKDNETIPNESGSSYTIDNFDSSKEGIYTFTSTHPDFPGLVIEHEPVTIMDANPSAVKTIKDSEWSASPNPAKNMFRVAWKSGNLVEKRLLVFDDSDRKLLSTIFTTTLDINCSDWTAGPYSILLLHKGQIGLKKLIKQ